jgi:hypothetical protein
LVALRAFLSQQEQPAPRLQIDDMADMVELRGPCDREIVDVIDAHANARGLTRSQMVNAVLGDWARDRVHESTVLLRVLRINPLASDGPGRKGAL